MGDYNTYLIYAAWIDYNQDGVFDNATEMLHQSTGWGNYGFQAQHSPFHAMPCRTDPLEDKRFQLLLELCTYSKCLR